MTSQKDAKRERVYLVLLNRLTWMEVELEPTKRILDNEVSKINEGTY